ncbi:unnamed protein product [Caenorhabditis bovis]|uniref:Uncharacterized protein n=1 Tax=Caenorhabditis bovis TaxID=2654633 RepID=A0A8S1F623_9PELO|nr:unnamed protein product [Caenorhabditis bovis]
MSSKPSQLVCPTEAPAYYIMTLHTIAVVSLPFNITAFYLVWFHSPKSSKYRYCLLYVQLSTFFTEIYMSWVNPGYYFFPMIGGYNTSPLRKYISTPVSMSIYVFAFCFELPSYLICFLYRHECVLELDRIHWLSDIHHEANIAKIAKTNVGYNVFNAPIIVDRTLSTELATNSMFIIVAHSLTSSICMIVTNPRHLRILIDKLRLGRITGRFIGARKTTFAHVSSVLNTEKMAN